MIAAPITILGMLIFGSCNGDSTDWLQSLPTGWKVERTVELPASQLANMSNKLGGQIGRVSNHFLTVGGKRLQVNRVECKSDGDANKVYQAILRIKNNQADMVVRRELDVVEFLCDDIRLARRAHYELGLKPSRVTYTTSFEVAPLSRADYMEWNNLFNAFIDPDQGPAIIGQLKGRFQFASDLSVRGYGQGSARCTFDFSPAPVATKSNAEGDLITHSFADLPMKHGVPYVKVSARVTSEAFAITPSLRKPGPDLLGPTSFWPSNDPEIVALAGQITAGKTNTAEKVLAILDWLMPGKNIHYGGSTLGSRYGVKQLLQQKTGRCWDFSDAFVTLSRAAGIPSRQIVGWLHPREGHVWAEVLIDGDGWRSVDPTAGMGCGSDYVPIFTTETGDLSIVYTSAIRVRPDSN